MAFYNRRGKSVNVLDVGSALLATTGFTPQINILNDDEDEKFCSNDGPVRGSFERSKNISE